MKYQSALAQVKDGELLRWFIDLAANYNPPSSIRLSNSFKSCRTTIWISYQNGVFECDSDGRISLGIVYMLINTVSDMSVEQIKSLTIQDFGYIMKRLSMDNKKILQASLNKIKKLVDKH